MGNKNIQTNLDVAKPMFEFYLSNINWDIAQWLYLEKAVIHEHEIWFYFKSSSVSLEFRVYGGVNVQDLKSLSAYYDEAYLYFQRIKWNAPKIKKEIVNEFH